MSVGNPYEMPLWVSELTPARESIESALVSWMIESGHGMQDVTVSGLCKRAYVARSTFYTNYAHLDDVLDTVERRVLIELARAGRAMERHAGGEESVVDSYDEFVAVLHRHEQLFRLLLVDDCSARFVERWKQLLKYHFWERLYGPERSANNSSVPAGQCGHSCAVNRALMLEMVAASFVAGVQFWLRTPQDVGMPEIKSLILRLIRDIDENW